MGFAGTGTVGWILPALLTAAWLPLWMAGRRVRFWFFIAGFAVSIVCIPAGMIAAKMELSGTTCNADDLCFSMREVYWWVNGLYGLVTCFALVMLTLTIESVRQLARH
jgi:hypothetical protein